MAKTTRMKPAMRARYVNHHLNSMRLLEKQARNIVLKVYKKQKPKVLDFVRSGKSVKQLQHELPSFYKESIKPIWAAALKPIWNNAAKEADSQTTDWIAPNAVKKAWEDTADKFMQENAGAKIDGITGTDQEWLANTLRSGTSEGKSIDEIAADLSEDFDNMSIGRATTIARTEIAGAYNHASQETAKDLMPEGATKTWYTTSDSPRPSHEAMDGTEIGINEMFELEGGDLAFPGDPNGPVEEVVNCMCVLEYSYPSGSEGATPEDGEE